MMKIKADADPGATPREELLAVADVAGCEHAGQAGEGARRRVESADDGS
jgi:hypothetical protein